MSFSLPRDVGRISVAQSLIEFLLFSLQLARDCHSLGRCFSSGARKSNGKKSYSNGCDIVHRQKSHRLPCQLKGTSRVYKSTRDIFPVPRLTPSEWAHGNELSESPRVSRRPVGLSHSVVAV